MQFTSRATTVPMSKRYIVIVKGQQVIQASPGARGHASVWGENIQNDSIALLLWRFYCKFQLEMLDGREN